MILLAAGTGELFGALGFCDTAFAGAFSVDAAFVTLAGLEGSGFAFGSAFFAVAAGFFLSRAF